jgi:cyclopropane-fatty-acyl-phospholipid synthase
LSETALPPGKKLLGPSLESIRQHYELSNEFFALWLDPLMLYTCAFYDGTDDFAEAQVRKLDHHIEAANAAGKDHVLDLGCGWGALSNRLVGHAGVKRATGLTLSAEQAKWARERALPGVEIRLEDWRDHKPEKPYDAILAVGLFEHLAHHGIEPAKKAAAYREFFTWCEKWLAPAGRLTLQFTAWTLPPSSYMRQRFTFIQDMIFPDSELPYMQEVFTAAEGHFEVLALRNDREHYYRTLRQWEANLMANRKEAIALVGEEAVDNVRHYLRLSAGAFKIHQISLLRMSFQRAV